MCIFLRNFYFALPQIHFIAETSSADDPSDVIELPSPEDRLLGASICDSTPVWFSRCHGLVSVTAADFPPGICPGSLEATINR